MGAVDEGFDDRNGSSSTRAEIDDGPVGGGDVGDGGEDVEDGGGGEFRRALALDEGESFGPLRCEGVLAAVFEYWGDAVGYVSSSWSWSGNARVLAHFRLLFGEGLMNLHPQVTYLPELPSRSGHLKIDPFDQSD